MRSLTDPPPRTAFARFDPAFGQRFLLTVEAEEGCDCARLAAFQQFCETEGVVPVYLVDRPFATSARAAEILRGPLAAAKAEIGAQPDPIDDRAIPDDSLSGNLPRDRELANIRSLRDEIARKFEIAPAICRAGRDRVGRHTAALLLEGGVAVDSSVRAKFDYSAQGGPDFRSHPLVPYWLDDERRLLELPLTTVYWGLLRRQGDWLAPTMARVPRLRGLLARGGLLERIPLTPEGFTVDQAIRGIDIALDDGLPLLVFAFHGSTLCPGHTPYVRNDDDLAGLYDWWRRVLAYLDLRGVASTTVTEVLNAVHR